MSLQQIRSVIEDFINSTRNELLIIKGDWGVGKSHFWDRLMDECRKKGVIGRDYYARASVFGLNSLDELKTAIAISRVESRSNRKLDSINRNLAKLLKQIGKVPVVEKYGGGSIATLLHAVVNDTLVCIDDIERKGSSLDIRDILGLATQLKEERNCKVVLIVNEDKLRDAREEFKSHGEKIVDRQVRFTLTPEESFECVFNTTQLNYDLIKACVFALNIPNIRTTAHTARYRGYNASPQGE
jgi:hypothetical protein